MAKKETTRGKKKKAVKEKPAQAEVKKASGKARRGVVVAGAENEPARFEAHRSAGPLQFDPAWIAEQMGLWWENGSGDKYLIYDEEEGWSTWNEGKIFREMRDRFGPVITPRSRDDERTSTFDQVLLHVMKKRRVALVLPSIGGYAAGMHFDQQGRRFIVCDGTGELEAAEGEWPLIRDIIEKRMNLGLKSPGGIDQSKWFYSWLKYADEARRAGPGNFASGHCLIMASKRGSGKGFIQAYIITPLLGAREADPKQFLLAKRADDFNSELVEAEHWMQEEVPLENQHMSSRVLLSERIKDAVTKTSMRLRLMQTNPLIVYPFHRLTISINDDPDKMRNLPLITGDFSDKIIMLKLAHADMPMPTGSIEEKKTFRAAIAAELPAFLWWLRNEFEIPSDLLVYPDTHPISPGGPATRFGFREFQHPELVSELFDDTPAAELLMLIDAAVFTLASGGVIEQKLWELPSHAKQPADGSPQNRWHGSALTLETLLRGDDETYNCSVAKTAQKLFAHNKCDRLLSRLAEDQEEREYPRVAAHRFTGGRRGWVIVAPQSSL